MNQSIKFLDIMCTFQQRPSRGKLLNQGSGSDGGTVMHFGRLLCEGVWRKVELWPSSLTLLTFLIGASSFHMQALILTPKWNLLTVIPIPAHQGLMIK